MGILKKIVKICVAIVLLLIVGFGIMLAMRPNPREAFDSVLDAGIQSYETGVQSYEAGKQTEQDVQPEQ